MATPALAEQGSTFDSRMLTYEDGADAKPLGSVAHDNAAFAAGASLSYGEGVSGNTYVKKTWEAGAACLTEQAEVTYIDALGDGDAAHGVLNTLSTSLKDKGYMSVDFDMATNNSYPAYAATQDGGLLVSLDFRYGSEDALTEACAPLFRVVVADGVTTLRSIKDGSVLATLQTPTTWSHITAVCKMSSRAVALYLDGVQLGEWRNLYPSGAVDTIFFEGLQLTVQAGAQMTTACSVKLDNVTTAVYTKAYEGTVGSLFTGSSDYRIEINYYPGYVRKAMTFTLDDGDLERDKTFFSYTEPAGFKGVVNLISSKITEQNKQAYIDMYSDYEIGNHGKFHVFRLQESDRSKIASEPFHPSTADKNKLYIADAQNKIYHCYVVGVSGWREAMFVEDFKACVAEGDRELEQIFGCEVSYYAFPNGFRTGDYADDPQLPAYIQSLGYYGVRKTGDLGGTTKFALPADYAFMTYNATVGNLLEYARAYDELEDDGKLKYFCFGLHAADYQNSWNVLATFCDTYGNRPDEFWYATDREIYEYAKAMEALVVDKGCVTNDSDVTLYIKVGGENKVIEPHSTVDFGTSRKLTDAADTVYMQHTAVWNTAADEPTPAPDPDPGTTPDPTPSTPPPAAQPSGMSPAAIVGMAIGGAAVLGGGAAAWYFVWFKRKHV